MTPDVMDQSTYAQAAAQMPATEAPKAGLLEKIKDTLNPDNLAQRFNLTKSRLLEMGLYLLVGFIVGFLLKKYSRFVFAVALIAILLIILQQLNVLTFAINWAEIRELLGIQPTQTTPDMSLFSVYWEWVKANVALVLSFSVGFLVGLRLA